VNPWDVMRRLYDSEINAGMQSDWHGGISVWIGGPEDTGLNPVQAKATFLSSEFDRVGEWLESEARRLYPISGFARATP
jgi:hypothetical protein